MTLSKKELRSVIDDPCVGHRPFVCRRQPESCTVMIVGANPGTPMNTNWWDWWKDDTGFNKDKFMQAYQKRKQQLELMDAREQKRLPKKISALKGARARMERLHSEHHLRCLETNIYSEERRRGHGGKPNMKVVRLLISRLPLKAV